MSKTWIVCSVLLVSLAVPAIAEVGAVEETWPQWRGPFRDGRAEVEHTVMSHRREEYVTSRRIRRPGKSKGELPTGRDRE